ncbi:SMI1/KNR4 family protein [Nocardia sp. NPDC050713]|uniref:SMI1/KNR4 family protein n=1 Tax=Nocardia sp. NPDC050713 TaxID=3154511 RepID=UPI0033E58142
MSNDRNFEGMKHLRQELLASGVASEDEIVGCSVSEIEDVSSRAGSFRLPDQYLAFLQVMGRRAGELFEGTDIFYPRSLEAREAAIDVASGDGESLSLENRFFFGHHQGYKVYFFEPESPAVFTYQEGNPEVRMLAKSLLAFLQHALEVRMSADK